MKRKPLWLKWIFCLIPLIIAALMYFLLPLFPNFTEYAVSRGIFRIIGFPLQWIMSLLPFSFAELMVVLAIPLLLTLLIIWITRIVRKQNKLNVFEKGIRFVAWCISLSLLIYMTMHGANYYRLPLSELMSLPDRAYSVEDLYTVTCDLAEKAAEVREKLPEDENGCVKFSKSQSEILKLADDCYNNIGKEYPFLKTGVWRVKSVVLSKYLSYTNTTGIYCPWTSEANVNTDVPDFTVSHTAAHEIAHTMGLAKENECNFIAWLACSKSGIADYEYSGHLAAFTYCINVLYKADRDLYSKARTYCSEGMFRDLKNQNAYWDKFDGEVAEVSQNFNDSFIKANRDKNGVLSYNLMVELLLRYYDIDII